MFKKILIANRGEIACRIMRTASRMGLRTVAIYSEADRGAVHARMADEAVCVGPPASASSYLDVKAIVAAIRATGADCVHPGYGFLSENAAFARRLKREGVAFIGPTPKAIDAMGDKIESKRLAARAGVSTVPGHDGEVDDVRLAVTIARRIGYPVMLKASAGGGGKGMRVAGDDAEVREGFAAARREAKASFGDDRLLIEKFIEQPRHIEIQVLADSHGHTVYLGERECSIQRRHQKVIEEAPSPFLDEPTRRAMGEQAVALARAVGYTSAGTVEFIVDGKRNFYFLEMNTRLQVEHPVTECITGLDLVEEMIRIAAGEPLRFRQEDVRRDGWAIEARVYAEDPSRGFLPSIGRLARYRQPAETDGIRVDAGVVEGGEISMYYDPMIAKLVASGADRDEAIRRMGAALDSFVIEGVANNLAFLAALMAHPRFREGRLTTGFIAEEFPDGFAPEKAEPADPVAFIAVAGAVHQAYQLRAADIPGQVSGHERKVRDTWIARLHGVSYDIRIEATDGGWSVVVDGRPVALRSGWRLGDLLFQAAVDGEARVFRIARQGIAYRLAHGGCVADVLVLSPRTAELAEHMPEKRHVDTSHLVVSPMPGLLVSLAVAKGQAVKAGEPLAVIEAMKMENVLRAERDGVVGVLHVKAGDNLRVDQPILEYEMTA